MAKIFGHCSTLCIEILKKISVIKNFTKKVLNEEMNNLYTGIRVKANFKDNLKIN